MANNLLLFGWFRRFSIGIHRAGLHVATDSCSFLMAEITFCCFPLSAVAIDMVYKERQYHIKEPESSQDLL